MVRGVGVGEEQLSTIKAAMQSTYTALPKNKYGGLTHSATSYLVHEYFARKYQWHFRGLSNSNQHGAATHGKAPLHKTTILQEMAPEFVEGLLDARESGHGLYLSDAAAMAATLHSLVRNDAEVLLEKSYELLNTSTSVRVDSKGLVKILLAYSYATSGQLDKPMEIFVRRLQKPTHFMTDFTKNAVNIAETLAFQQRGRINPFVPRTFSFDEILDLVDQVLREFGQWQDQSCMTMKDHLQGLDPNGAGRVPLGLFYAQPDMGAYRFSESAEYLRKTGALDESTPSSPEVLISNYVMGPGNCYSSSTYFQYCCINQCSNILAGIEAQIEGSEAAPQDVLYAVGNASAAISIELEEEAQSLPEPLIEKLDSIAKRHGGKVPIHGRLFAQWLHFGFPVKCPYPHMPTSESSNDALTANDFLKTANEQEMQQYIAASGHAGSASERTLSQWTDDEILLDAPSHAMSDFVRGAFRAVAIVSVIVLTVMSLLQRSRAVDNEAKLLTSMEKVV
jgi:hypothetical protein